jgi:hypothetical protein
MACGLMYDSGFQGSAEPSPTLILKMAIAISHNTVQLEHMTWLNPRTLAITKLQYLYTLLLLDTLMETGL